ncbi:hypothetical protein E6Q11_06225 [Candidatus Dojkabacteria bacterium]|uniref:Cyanophage baseplate Pam3 plug gp18 domain-containing protein n=1 Tax=Candidatus Dojkabacteria bacterium TaxID=2099670 RepID=A0A5C7J3P8_9BACT|nr:MAG: hypothetical protein E6Q11_06225 [Candidatus Dojkabacteria bacterium]
MIEIALSSNAPHFSQEHLIFDRHYIIELQWIERESYWVMHLYDGVEVPIALGLRVTPHWPIYVDKILGTAFVLLARNPNAELSRSSLHEDYMLVVHVI